MDLKLAPKNWSDIVHSWPKVAVAIEKVGRSLQTLQVRVRRLTIHRDAFELVVEVPDSLMTAQILSEELEAMLERLV